MIQEIKEPLHFACINYTTVVVLIYGIGLVLSCQIQDDVSLYYNTFKVKYSGLFRQIGVV